MNISHQGRSEAVNRATPMEARLGVEVGHAVANMGMKREQANEIAFKLLATYEDQTATASMGKEYHECCDVHKALPIHEHYDMYCKVKDEIADEDLLFRPREVSYKNPITKR